MVCLQSTVKRNDIKHTAVDSNIAECKYSTDDLTATNNHDVDNITIDEKTEDVKVITTPAKSFATDDFTTPTFSGGAANPATSTRNDGPANPAPFTEDNGTDDFRATASENDIANLKSLATNDQKVGVQTAAKKMMQLTSLIQHQIIARLAHQLLQKVTVNLT